MMDKIDGSRCGWNRC